MLSFSLKKILYVLSFFIFTLDIIILSLLFFRYEIMYFLPKTKLLYEQLSIPTFHEDVILSDIKAIFQHRSIDSGNVTVYGRIKNTSYRPSHVPLILILVKDHEENNVIVQILKVDQNQIKGLEEISFRFNLTEVNYSVNYLLGSLIYQ